MTSTAIINVEINDGAWKSFQNSVAKHQATLRQMPGQWGAVGTSIAKAGDSAAKFVAKIKEANIQFQQANTFAGKLTLALKASDRAATSLGRSTLAVGKNLKDATKTLLSWVGISGVITGALGLIGGGFGLHKLATDVSAGQTAAKRTGSSYGAVKAAGIAYGQLLGGEEGVQSLLERMAKEKESGGVMFRRAGLAESDWKTKSPADILGPFLQAIKDIYKKAPEGAQAKAMEAMIPELDFNTIKQLSDTNVSVLQNLFEENKKQLEISRGTQDAWANFSRQLQSAAEQIENVFVKALGPLTPALAAFSKSLIDAFKIIMGSPLVKGMIAGAGEGMKKAASYLSSEEFPKDLKAFIAELKKIGEAISETASFLHKWVGPGAEKQSPEDQLKEISQWENRKAQMEKVRQYESFSHRERVSMTKQQVEVAVKLLNAAGENINMQSYVAGGIQ